MLKLRPLTYANVVSTACLFVLLGGSAYAAVSITGKDVRLTDALIASFAVAGGGRPVERIGFDAARVETTAPVRACFDRVANGSR